jgi:hypothetical protein
MACNPTYKGKRYNSLKEVEEAIELESEQSHKRSGEDFGPGGFKEGRYNLREFTGRNKFGGSAAAQKLLEGISKHPYFDKVKLYIANMEPGVKGEAFVTADLIKASRNVDAETLAHEMMHFLTAKIFEKPYNTLGTSEKLLRNGVIDIIKKYDPEFKHLDGTLGKYGYKRSEYAQEVIAEAFLDSPFARELGSKKISVKRQVEIDKHYSKSNR